MALSNEDITRLLAKPDKVRSSKGSKIDTSDRRVEVWFALAHKLFDADVLDSASCDNPDCIDPRPKGPSRRTVVAEVNGKNMCRHCFLAEWNLL